MRGANIFKSLRTTVIFISMNRYKIQIDNASFNVVCLSLEQILLAYCYYQ